MPTATINGLNIHYELEGEGFPIILAHGYCASIDMWSHLKPVLAKRYRVVTYDARGHGLSSAPAGKEHYTLTALVDDMHALLGHLDMEEAYLTGHSMGGATVQAFAARYPEMTRATLICNIDGGHQPTSESEARQAEEARAGNHALVRDRGLTDYARHQLETGTAPAFVRDSPHEQRTYLERYARQSVNGFFGVGEALPWRDPWLKDTVESLTGAVAIIAGTEDAMHIGAEALHRELPRSRFVSIRDAPHDSVNARPAAFNQAVLDFLDTLESGAEPAGRFVL